MSYSKFGAAALVAAAALVQTSPADAAIIGAHSGKAFFSNESTCFGFDFNNPSRVRFTGSGCGANTGGWWAIPVPITSTGSKTISVHVKDSNNFADECWVQVMNPSGGIVRAARVTYALFEGWKTFPAQAVNSNEHVDVECFIGHEGFGEAWVSAVKGF